MSAGLLYVLFGEVSIQILCKQNRIRLIDTENRLTALRGEEDWGAGEKGERIKGEKKTPKLLDQV